MERIKIAFATNDGKTFISRHFGDANYYDIYAFDSKYIQFVKRISNNIEEGDALHASVKRARGIVGLLREEDVSVVVSKVFGPNIERIKKQFVCLIMKDSDIEDGIRKVRDNIRKIKNEWERGEERQYLSL